MADAGLSRTIFYRHFDGLPELVLSLFDAVTQALMSEVQGAPGPGATRGILEAAVDAYAEHGGLLRAVDEAARHDAEIETAYRAVVDAFTTVIAGQIEEGMAAGRIRPGNAYELARALNLMNGNYLLETLGRDPDFDRDPRGGHADGGVGPGRVGGVAPCRASRGPGMLAQTELREPLAAAQHLRAGGSDGSDDAIGSRCADAGCGGAGERAGTRAGERRRRALVRDQGRRDARLLGLQQRRPGDAPGRDVQRGRRGRASHLRDPDRRHRRLLGQERRRRVDAAVRDVQLRRAPAAITAAGCGRTTRSPAGGATRRRLRSTSRRSGPTCRSARATRPAPPGAARWPRAASSRAGATTRTAAGTRRPARSPTPAPEVPTVAR